MMKREWKRTNLAKNCFSRHLCWKKRSKKKKKKLLQKIVSLIASQFFFVVSPHTLETRRKRKEEEKELECLFSHFFPRVLMLIKHREVGLCWKKVKEEKTGPCCAPAGPCSRLLPSVKKSTSPGTKTLFTLAGTFQCYYLRSIKV